MARAAGLLAALLLAGCAHDSALDRAVEPWPSPASPPLTESGAEPGSDEAAAPAEADEAPAPAAEEPSSEANDDAD